MAYADESEWFEHIRHQFPFLGLSGSERAQRLRPGILKRLFGALLTDDERAASMGLPTGCRMREGAKILSPENLRIGEHCWIGENAILDASGGLEIGHHTSIGPHVFIWTHSSHLTNLCMDNRIGSDLIQRKKTLIGNGCFIAGPSVVLAGVAIGDKTVIRPFSLIEKDIPDRSLVDGNKIIEGFFTEEKIETMKKRHLSAT